VAPGRRQRWLWRREQAQARRLEAWICQHFDLVAVVSEDDGAALPGPAHVVPNGVDLGRFPFTDLPANHKLVLTATLGYLPNVDGAVWFARQVMPALLAAVPDAELTIVGRAATADVLALDRLPGVTVVGEVPSVVPYLEAARVAVVPLRVGSGTRLKALEAMAGGRPLAGTAIGLGGLGLRDGRDAVIADEAGALAAGIARLLTDDSTAAAMRTSARSLVEDRFTWERIGHRYVELLRRATSLSEA
jgi:glycosyltransferase involved in cell wall biosynthesis